MTTSKHIDIMKVGAVVAHAGNGNNQDPPPKRT